MQNRSVNTLRLSAVSMIMFVLLGCGNDQLANSQEDTKASLDGTWELEAVTGGDSGPVPASRDAYAATLVFSDKANTFSLTEWKDGGKSVSSGSVVIEKDRLYLIHTEDYRTATRVDDTIYSIKSGKLMLATGKTEWTVLIFDKQ